MKTTLDTLGEVPRFRLNQAQRAAVDRLLKIVHICLLTSSDNKLWRTNVVKLDTVETRPIKQLRSRQPFHFKRYTNSATVTLQRKGNN